MSVFFMPDFHERQVLADGEPGGSSKPHQHRREADHRSVAGVAVWQRDRPRGPVVQGRRRRSYLRKQRN